MGKDHERGHRGNMGEPWPGLTHPAKSWPSGKHFNIVPSFGLQQSNSADGSIKYRRIDDHTASHNNLAVAEDYNMAMVDYLAVLVKALGRLTSHPVRVGTEDMKNAYRQIPLPDGQVAISTARAV